jgi:hypothetical protein
MIQVYVEGHKGPDPNSLEMLCDSGAKEKLVSMKIDPISNFNVFSLYIELDMLLYLTWIICFTGPLYSEREGQKMDLSLTGSPVSSIRRWLIRLAEACRMGGMLTCDAISV